MSDDIAITVRNVGKAYRIWESPASRLSTPLLELAARSLPARWPSSRWLHRKAASRYRDFWALKEISFDVRQGESVGIVGRNGSGKSTLLQTIAGTLQPTEGSVQVNGRVAALLELGSGFNPEFTGRENVFMNGAVLGLSRREMEARFDQIAAFADIGDFIEQPVKIYSSGMVVRLAFAVCAHVDARILIIDEALGVGDARFQLKCARTIDRFMEEGRTLLFVSHDVSSVNRLCSAAILLEKGRNQILHSPRTVTNLYAKMMVHDRGLDAIAEDLVRAKAKPFDRTRLAPVRPATFNFGKGLEDKFLGAPAPEAASGTSAGGVSSPAPAQPELAAAEEQKEALLSASETADSLESSEHEFTTGGETAHIEAIEVLDADGHAQRAFRTGDRLEIRARIRAHRNIPQPVFACRMRNSRGMDVYGTNTFFLKTPTPDLSAGQVVEVRYQLALNILAGAYFISCSCAHFEGAKLVVHHRRRDAVELQIFQDNQTFGIADCDATIACAILPGTGAEEIRPGGTPAVRPAC